MCAEPVARVALVVEDEWIVRDLIVSELKAQGWTVAEAATGEDALALLANREVHVLLTDIQLAGIMNGWEVAHAMRAAIPELPVIYIRQQAGPLAAGRRKSVLPQAVRSC